MTKNIENIKIDTKGFYDLFNRLNDLEEENEKNQSLRLDNDFLQNTALKIRCSKLGGA